jgi:enoyl-[acyl-carrier protein] reductase I
MTDAVTDDRAQGQLGGTLAGKVCLVMGVQNRWSIAYAIGKAMTEAGGRLAVTYVDDRAKRDADALIAEAPGAAGYACNVESDEELDALGASLARDFGRVDALVHSIGFAPAAEMQGRFIDTSREGFRVAHSVSVYSLIAAARRVVPLMTEGGSITTLTYLGADRVFPRYNVMGVAKAALEASVRYLAADLGPQGVRVNAISAGPLKTAAARGIPGFSEMWGTLHERAPLKTPFDAAKVGGAAVFLASDAAAAITGETIFVDNGYHMMGM